MSRPAPFEHPGHTAAAMPGYDRRLCPFCRWYVDFPSDTDAMSRESVLSTHIEWHVAEMISP